MRRWPLFRPALLLALFPSVVYSQSRSIDEAAFRISLNGEVVGREEFSIRQAGAGDQAQLILRGTVDLNLPTGPIDLAPAMIMDAGGQGASTYEIKVSGSEATEIGVRNAGGRYLVNVKSAIGEELREFRAGPGSVILDEGVAHHHFLLTPFLEEASGAALTILIPREGRQARMSLAYVGEDQVPVGMQHLDARHFRLDSEDGPRDIWFDEQWRLLRVEISSKGYLAEREKMD